MTSNSTSPKPCVRCNHVTREHLRKNKKTNGTWYGRCEYWDCDCDQYIEPKLMMGSLQVKNFNQFP